MSFCDCFQSLFIVPPFSLSYSSLCIRALRPLHPLGIWDLCPVSQLSDAPMAPSRENLMRKFFTLYLFFFLLLLKTPTSDSFLSLDVKVFPLHVTLITSLISKTARITLLPHDRKLAQLTHILLGVSESKTMRRLQDKGRGQPCPSLSLDSVVCAFLSQTQRRSKDNKQTNMLTRRAYVILSLYAEDGPG